jgi:hypothetical protein
MGRYAHQALKVPVQSEAGLSFMNPNEKLNELKEFVPFDTDNPFPVFTTPGDVYKFVDKLTQSESINYVKQGHQMDLKNQDFKHLKDVMEEPDEDISWIIDELLPSGGFSIIVAKPKVGKSTLVRQMALAVSKGDSFLDRSTHAGSVLYVALEEKQSEVKKHFSLLGFEGQEPIYLYVGSVPQDAQKWLEEGIQKHRPVLVIIDTLFRFVNIRNGNDYAEVTKALTPILDLTRTYKAHVMVVHHAGKGDRDASDVTLGSTAILGSVDTQIVLKKKDGRRTIETVQRYGKDMEATVLEYDENARRTTLGVSKESSDIDHMEELISDFLFDQTEPCLQKEIEEAVEGRTALKRRALKTSVQKGLIQRAGTGKKKDPFLYSCSLVPALYVEQVKQVSQSEQISPEITAKACSQAVQDSETKGRNDVKMSMPLDGEIH